MGGGWFSFCFCVFRLSFRSAVPQGNRVRNQSGGTNSNTSTVTSSPDTEPKVAPSAVRNPLTQTIDRYNYCTSTPHEHTAHNNNTLQEACVFFMFIFVSFLANAFDQKYSVRARITCYRLFSKTYSLSLCVNTIRINFPTALLLCKLTYSDETYFSLVVTPALLLSIIQLSHACANKTRVYSMQYKTVIEICIYSLLFSTCRTQVNTFTRR